MLDKQITGFLLEKAESITQGELCKRHKYEPGKDKVMKDWKKSKMPRGDEYDWISEIFEVDPDMGHKQSSIMSVTILRK